jgi:hypothetical protein
MSGPTIRIGESVSFPDVTAVNDIGPTIEIGNMNDFDLGLLGNQRKMTQTQARPASPGGGMSELREVDNIEFVSLDEGGVSFDVKPTPSTGDTIKIVRDNASQPKSEMSLNFNQQPAAAPAPASAATTAPATQTWFGFGKPAATESAPTANGWFGGSAAKTEEPIATYLSPEQEAIKKSEALTMLERMDRKGVGGTKMTVANSLDEINAEVARRKDSKGLEASLRFQRSMMTTVTSGMEFLNNRYDPVGVKLDGWSESINENIEDYDEIFEELYDKYKDRTKVAPEVRLIMSLGLSAAMCHLTNTMFKSNMPGMDDILRKNPDLARQMARAAAEQAVGPGFANFMSMGNPGGSGPSRPMPPPGPRSQQSPMRQQEEEDQRPMFMPPMGSGIGAPIETNDPRGNVQMGQPPVTIRREMTGPKGVDVSDILQTLERNGMPTPNRTVPDQDDQGSVVSGLTTNTERRSGIRRPRRTPVQPTGATLSLNF